MIDGNEKYLNRDLSKEKPMTEQEIQEQREFAKEMEERPEEDKKSFGRIDLVRGKPDFKRMWVLGKFQSFGSSKSETDGQSLD